VCNILAGKPEGRRSLGRPRRRLEDKIRMDIREVGWEDVVESQVAQGTDKWRNLMNTVINVRDLFIAATLSFSRKTLFHGIS